VEELEEVLVGVLAGELEVLEVALEEEEPEVVPVVVLEPEWVQHLRMRLNSQCCLCSFEQGRRH
jgi:CRISPR/Cas system-associated protein Csm6